MKELKKLRFSLNPFKYLENRRNAFCFVIGCMVFSTVLFLCNHRYKSAIGNILLYLIPFTLTGKTVYGSIWRSWAVYLGYDVVIRADKLLDEKIEKCLLRVGSEDYYHYVERMQIELKMK